MKLRSASFLWFGLSHDLVCSLKNVACILNEFKVVFHCGCPVFRIRAYLLFLKLYENSSVASAKKGKPFVVFYTYMCDSTYITIPDTLSTFFILKRFVSKLHVNS